MERRFLGWFSIQGFMGVIVVLYVELGLVLHCTDEYLGTNRCRSVVKRKKNNNFNLLLFRLFSGETQNKYEMLMSCFSFIFDWLVVGYRTEPSLSFISLFVLPRVGNKTTD